MDFSLDLLLREGSLSCRLFCYVHMIHAWEISLTRFPFCTYDVHCVRRNFPPKMWVKQLSSLFAQLSHSLTCFYSPLPTSKILTHVRQMENHLVFRENSFKSSIKMSCNLSSLNAIQFASNHSRAIC